MSLIIQLGCAEQGSNLIQTVEEAMKEAAANGWKYDRSDKCFMREVLLDNLHPLKSRKSKTLTRSHRTTAFQHAESKWYLEVEEEDREECLRLSRYTGKGRTRLALSLLTPLLRGKNPRDIVKDPHMLYMSLHDSIFTLLNPNELYTELEFHANAAFDFSNPADGGVVESEEAPQFRKVKEVFDNLVGYILQRREAQHPYR